MYLPAHFAESRLEVLHDLVRREPFGQLVTRQADDISADGIPFLIDTEKDAIGERGIGTLRAHVARANPLWREARTDVESLVIFQGPQAYVSPGWYASKAEHGKVVPTWNYIVVQARGTLRAIDDAAWVRGLVTRLTDRHEAALPRPWSINDAPPAFTDMMIGQIVGIEIVLTSLVGKWKVSQNRSTADRAGVIRGLEQVSAAATTMARAIETSVRKV